MKYERPDDYPKLSINDKSKVDVAIWCLNNEGLPKTPNITSCYFSCSAKFGISYPTAQRYTQWYIKRYGKKD